jgi:chromosomal replication initiation ATPase DnaA
LGDGDFVQNVLAAAEENMKRCYAFQANGVNLESLAERVAEIFDIPSSELWIPGKHRWRVRAKSVLCYWAVRDLEVSMSELSRRMNVSVMAISNAVQRGEKIVKELDISFY